RGSDIVLQILGDHARRDRAAPNVLGAFGRDPEDDSRVRWQAGAQQRIVEWGGKRHRIPSLPYAELGQLIGEGGEGDSARIPSRLVGEIGDVLPLLGLPDVREGAWDVRSQR